MYQVLSLLGSQHALHMLLNIEQYEYMAGPNKGAGVRILLHDQQQVPTVRDASMSIPPGAHALVGGEIVQVGTMKNYWIIILQDKGLIKIVSLIK